MSGGTTHYTVILKGRGIRKEALSGGIIQPGDLIKRNSSGQFIRHATSNGKASRLFAVENELFGKGIDTNYASGDNVLAEACYQGMEVQCNIAAAAPAIVIGDLLVSAGDGTLRKLTSTDAPALTDSSTGTASTTVHDGTASYSQSVTNNNIATLAAAINELTATGGNVVAIALTAVDNSGGGSIVQTAVEIV